MKIKRQKTDEFNSVHSGVIFLAAIMAVLGIQEIIRLINRLGNSPLDNPYVMLLANMSLQLGFVLAAVIVPLVFGVKFFRGTGFRKITVAQGFISAAIAVVCFGGFFFINMALSAFFQLINFDLGGGIPMGTPGQIVLALIMTVVLAGTCEELVFSGGLMWGIKKDFGKWAAILLSGVAFSLMHMSPLQTFYQFFLGCVIGYVAIEFKSIIPAIIIHAGSNAVAIGLSAALSGLAGAEEVEPLARNQLIMSMVWFIIIGVVLLSVAIAVIILLVKFGKWLKQRKEPLAAPVVAVETQDPFDGTPVFEPAVMLPPPDTEKRKRQIIFGVLFGITILICAAGWVERLMIGLGG